MKHSAVFTVKSNARRAAKKAGANPNSVIATRGGYVFDVDSKITKAGQREAKAKAKAIKARIGGAAKPAKAKAAKAGQPRTARNGAGEGTAAVVALMCRKTGALITEICAATKWLPHTARARISGIAKKHRRSHSIERTRDNGVSRYTMTSSTQQELPLAKQEA